MIPVAALLPELVQADEVGVEDGHVAPVDRDGPLGDEEAVRVIRKPGPVALDEVLDGLPRCPFHLQVWGLYYKPGPDPIKLPYFDYTLEC